MIPHCNFTKLDWFMWKIQDIHLGSFFINCLLKLCSTPKLVEHRLHYFITLLSKSVGNSMGKLQADTQAHNKQVCTPSRAFALESNSNICDCRISLLALHDPSISEQFPIGKSLGNSVDKLQADTQVGCKWVCTPSWTFALASNSKIGEFRMSLLAPQSQYFWTGLHIIAVCHSNQLTYPLQDDWIIVLHWLGRREGWHQCRHRFTWPCHIRSASYCSQCFLLHLGQGVLTVLQHNACQCNIHVFITCKNVWQMTDHVW